MKSLGLLHGNSTAGHTLTLPRILYRIIRGLIGLTLCFITLSLVVTSYTRFKLSSQDGDVNYTLHDSDERIYISRLNDTYIKETNALQSSFSRILFWKESLADIKLNSNIIAHSDIMRRNNALLSYFTDDEHSPAYKSINDFSLVSTAFIQNYFVEMFSPAIDRHIHSPPHQRKTIELYEKLLFPWLKLPIKVLYQSFNGRGIVICTGNFHFNLAFMLVKTLREVLKSDLPIEIMYGNEQDLSQDKRDLISKFDNVVCVDLSERFIASKLKGVSGWWLKAYSILLSSFSETIFIDADVLFMVDPSSLFDHSLYVKYGALLFRDRQIHLGNDYEKLVGAFPFASDTLKNTGLWKKTSTHEAESGVLVYNKNSYSAFFALLTTCNLANDPMQKIAGSFFHGDKETFWMGFELLHLPWQFMKPYGATVGYSTNPTTVCGSLAHSDEQGNLLWMNGGLAVDKGNRADEIYDFEYYASDDKPNQRGSWTWVKGHLEELCWKAGDYKRQVKKLSDEQKELFKKYISIYKDVRKGSLFI